MQTIVSIQALRAVAAISVLSVHFNEIWFRLIGRSLQGMPLYPLASGVDLFFVISGFIMVHSSKRLFGAPGGSWIFLTGRIARIVPLYWLATLIAIPEMSRPATFETVTRSLFFIPYPEGEGLPLLGVGWTLNFEMFFYTLFSVAIWWPRKIALPVLAAFLVGLAVVGSRIALPGPLRFWADPIVIEFVFGMTIAGFYAMKIQLPNAARCCLMALAAGAVWLSAALMPPSGDRFLVWGIPATIIVACAVLGKPMRTVGPLAWFIGFLGDASYSMYLIHPLVGAAVFLSWPLSVYYFSPLVLTVLGAATSILAGIASFLLFERRTTIAIRHLLRGAPAISTHPS